LNAFRSSSSCGVKEKKTTRRYNWDFLSAGTHSCSCPLEKETLRIEFHLGTRANEGKTKNQPVVLLYLVVSAELYDFCKTVYI
jgi:hypothetical protein